MSLFRVDPNEPVRGPHQEQPVMVAGPALKSAGLAMILIHGRGASAEGMLQFADELDRNDIHYRAPQARGHTWYPRSFLAPQAMNEPGISSGLQVIHDRIQAILEEGMPSEKIVLLGFSQGACLATEFAARHPRRFGAVIGLSGGLIGESVNPEAYTGSMDITPVFLGCSDSDPHIPEERVEITARVFDQLDAAVQKKIYPGLGHTVNGDEIANINQILATI